MGRGNGPPNIEQKSAPLLNECNVSIVGTNSYRQGPGDV